MNKIYKSILGVSAAAVVLAGTLTPAFVSAWGDSANGRPSYTLDQINNGELGDTITFNSISNGKIGDEKNFVGAKVAGATVETWNANEIEVKDGETYTIRLFVHNNSPKGMDAIAKGVKATFSLPTTVAKSHTIIGYLDSSNATPNRYWDEVTLKSSDNFYLEYVDGSAKYNNNKGTFSLSNDVIISGATLGFDKMNGEIPGCYEYSGVVTINVKVHKSVSAKVSKQVRLKGTKTWSESVNAKVGDEVEYQIEYVNLLADQVNNVMIRDILPTNVEYMKDSTYLYNSQYQNGLLLKDNTLTTSGINIGSYSAKGNAYVRFTGKVVDKTLACGDNQLVNWANSTVNGAVVGKDDASVMVNKSGDVCKDKPTPPTPTPDNPTDTPTTIVATGPATIVTGAVGTGSVVTMLGYYIASRKKLMK
ncbi:DUF11 domain-containing protein [Candidatus Nanosyncoccus alces]|uniref:DUF11 domain-containing protein n=1 Tax=Candidatus Nanosyncoccus alces TaxID=2171997 RepID=A0ABY0FM81_9BACT|nr:DUF11 domain-containing protein [Candidatus Nanosyncoccus alces]RYC74840.1 hypothetical protein G3RUM_00389 [Candidatus Nanosyncoccus alces]